MKIKTRCIGLSLIAIMSFTTLSSCMGGYSLFHRVLKWNKTLGSKWLNSTVHFILYVICVYPVCFIIDFFVLNTIEFWTGTNPMAMAPGEKETQMVTMNDETFMITATRNRFDVEPVSTYSLHRHTALVYDENTCAWFAEGDGNRVKLAQHDAGDMNRITAYHADGTAVTLDLAAQ